MNREVCAGCDHLPHAGQCSDGCACEGPPIRRARTTKVCQAWCGKVAVRNWTGMPAPESGATAWLTGHGRYWCRDRCRRNRRPVNPPPKSARQRKAATPALRSGRVCLDVACIEFDVGGNTIWVQGRHGTVLRIKTLGGKILADECKTSPGSHGDVMTSGDIKICLGTEDKASGQ